MTLIGEELTAHAMLDEVLRVSSSRRPEKACTKRLAYKGTGYGIMTAETGMYLYQELPSLLFRDTPLEYSGSALFV